MFYQYGSNQAIFAFRKWHSGYGKNLKSLIATKKNEALQKKNSKLSQKKKKIQKKPKKKKKKKKKSNKKRIKELSEASQGKDRRLRTKCMPINFTISCRVLENVLSESFQPN
jgi:hypothetical protein